LSPDQPQKTELENPSQADAADGSRQDAQGADSVSTNFGEVTHNPSEHNQDAESPAARQSNSMSRRLLFLVGVLVLVGIVTVYAFSGSQIKDTGPKLTHEVTRGDLVVSVTEQGTLESSNNTEIKCRVRGHSKVTWVLDGGTEVQPGDELVRLDTKRIEDSIGTHATEAHTARAKFERTKADMEKAEIAIDAYLQGDYRAQLKDLKRQLEFSKSNLDAAEKLLVHSESLFRRGYVSKFEVESNRFVVKESTLDLKVRETAIEVLNKYTKNMELESLRGNLRALQSKYKADQAGLALDEGRRDRAIQELDYCVIKAERAGLVIYPSAAEWKETPDIAEGAHVRNDQVLLLMPDLTKMQVKVGIHETLIDKIKIGQIAKISLPDFTIEGTVKTVASVARPAGWWTGNVVKYDTVIELPQSAGLKPGMSAAVDVILAERKDVILVPVSAVVEIGDRRLCWIKTTDGVERRLLKLGESNDVFIVAESGLAEGDQVVLDPLRYVEDAKGEAIQSLDGSGTDDDLESSDEIHTDNAQQSKRSSLNQVGLNRTRSPRRDWKRGSPCLGWNLIGLNHPTSSLPEIGHV
jgi:multidrug efflux pump subunit AcrA (membrane-fusion protein)